MIVYYLYSFLIHQLSYFCLLSEIGSTLSSLFGGRSSAADTEAEKTEKEGEGGEEKEEGAKEEKEEGVGEEEKEEGVGEETVEEEGEAEETSEEESEPQTKEEEPEDLEGHCPFHDHILLFEFSLVLHFTFQKSLKKLCLM